VLTVKCVQIMRCSCDRERFLQYTEYSMNNFLRMYDYSVFQNFWPLRRFRQFFHNHPDF